MAMFNVFDIASSGVSAQMMRLNTIASNLANAEAANGDPNKVYKAKQVIFSTMYMKNIEGELDGGLGVKVSEVVDSKEPLRLAYEPNHPYANGEGYVYYPNVNMIEEMANMISTSRTYQNDINVIDTMKTLMQKTLALGQM